MNATRARGVHRLALGLLLAAAALAVLRALAEPAWIVHHQGWTLGRYGRLAGYYKENGYLLARLWPADLDHPTFSLLMMALPPSLFGLEPWSVRLAPALTSLAGAGGAYLLTRSLGGDRAGLLALALLLTCPAWFVYANLADPYVLAAGLGVVAIALYWRWLHGGGRWPLAAGLTLLAAMWTDWNGYFAALAVFLHFVASGRHRGRGRAVAAGLAALPFVAFGSFLVYASWISVAPISTALRDLLVLRLSADRARPTLSGWLTVARGFWERPDVAEAVRPDSPVAGYWLGPTVLLLVAAAGLWALARRDARDRLLLPACAATAALVQCFVFQSWALDHDFVMFFQLAFPAAILAGLTLDALVERTRRFGPVATGGLVAIALLGNGAALTSVVRKDPPKEAFQPGIYLVAQWLLQNAPATTTVIYPELPFPGYAFHSRLPLALATSPEELAGTVSANGGRAVVVARDAGRLQPEMAAALAGHPVRAVFGHLVADLGAGLPGPDSAALARVDGVAFEGLALRGYAARVRLAAPPPGPWLRLVNPHAAWLPERIARVTLDLDWEVGPTSPPDLELVAEVRGAGPPAAFTHRGLFGLRPTSLWSPGERVRESLVESADSLGCPCELWVGARRAGSATDASLTRVGPVELEARPGTVR